MIANYDYIFTQTWSYGSSVLPGWTCVWRILVSEFVELINSFAVLILSLVCLSLHHVTQLCISPFIYYESQQTWTRKGVQPQYCHFNFFLPLFTSCLQLDLGLAVVVVVVLRWTVRHRLTQTDSTLPPCLWGGSFRPSDWYFSVDWKANWRASLIKWRVNLQPALPLNREAWCLY